MLRINFFREIHPWKIIAICPFRCEFSFRTIFDTNISMAKILFLDTPVDRYVILRVPFVQTLCKEFANSVSSLFANESRLIVELCHCVMSYRQFY